MGLYDIKTNPEQCVKCVINLTDDILKQLDYETSPVLNVPLIRELVVKIRENCFAYFGD